MIKQTLCKELLADCQSLKYLYFALIFLIQGYAWQM